MELYNNLSLSRLGLEKLIRIQMLTMKLMDGCYLGLWQEDGIAVILSSDARSYWFLKDEASTFHSTNYMISKHRTYVSLILVYHNTFSDNPYLPGTMDLDLLYSKPFDSLSKLEVARYES